MNEFARILVPTDFGDAAARALDMAVELSKQQGGSLLLFHAYDIPVPLGAYQVIPALPPGYLETFRDAADRHLGEAVAELQKRVPAAKGVLACGQVWHEILEAAKREQATVIVMGTHGRTGLRHAFLGSVAEKVVRLSPIPVLTVRAPG